MTYRLERTNPVVGILELDQVKRHLLLDHDGQDTDLAGYIESARKQVENDTNVPIGVGEWIQSMDSFPLGGLPVKILTHKIDPTSIEVEYMDRDRNMVALPAEDYWISLFGFVPQINLVSGDWPVDAKGWQIKFIAGYDKCDLPAAIVHAMLSVIAYQFTNRGDVNPGGYPAEYWRLVSSAARPLQYDRPF